MKKITHSIVCLLGFLLISVSVQAAKRSYVCVFDPVGRDGDVFTLAEDLATDFLDLGVNLKLYPYSTESLAIQDFKGGLCDAVVITGMRSREFNRFSSTIEAIGAIKSYPDLITLLNTLSQPKAGRFFTQGSYEVAAIFPAGGVYPFLANRKWNSLNDLKSRRVIVMHGDEVSPYMIKELGARPVFGDTTTFARKFKRGQVDVIFSPAVVYEPFELEEGIRKQGGIINQPIMYLTLQMIVRKNAFPEGFGQKARQRVTNDWYDRALKIIQDSERKIDKKYWISPSQERVSEVQDVLRNARVKMRDKGIYDGTMLKILRKLRCKKAPTAKECINPLE